MSKWQICPSKRLRTSMHLHNKSSKYQQASRAQHKHNKTLFNITKRLIAPKRQIQNWYNDVPCARVWKLERRQEIEIENELLLKNI